jgi:hypothetical protein
MLGRNSSPGWSLALAALSPTRVSERLVTSHGMSLF